MIAFLLNTMIIAAVAAFLLLLAYIFINVIAGEL